MLDDASRGRSFPALANMVYLNTAAEGIPPVAVDVALAQYAHDRQLGMDGRALHYAQWDAARELVAQFYGLTAAEVSICSSSSEAYNLASLALQLRPDDEVIINDLDFPAGVTAWLQPNCPATAKLWRSRQGALHIEDLVPLLGPRTRLVTASLVSFYNGFMLSLPQLVEAVRRYSPALLALDVTQALGRVPLNLMGVDLIISSTHKWILASHGGGLVGVPQARAADWTVPAGGWFNLQDSLVVGPDRFERPVSRPGAGGFTVGMPNFPAVYAIRAALEYLDGVGVDRIAATARPLMAACLDGLASLPVELLTPRQEEALAGIIAFRHPQMETIHRHLHAANIHVMAHAGRIRVSIHGYNTLSDIERFLRELEQALWLVSSH
jgi:cysteine desulfurase / selenocysteine lyase